MSQNLLPDKLKQLRKARGLNQSALASSLNIEQSTYSGYETGKHHPNPDMLYKIASFYGISIDMLMRLATSENGNSDSSSPLLESMTYQMPNETQLLDDYLEFINSPENQAKYKELSSKEKELIYYFNQLSYIDKKDLLAFLKIRTSHT